MIRHYTGENEYGGITWTIKLKPVLKIYIQGTGEGNKYHVMIKEYMWLYMKERYKFISTEGLPETVSEALEQTYELLRRREDLEWPRKKMEAKKQEVLELLSQSPHYIEKIKPIESSSSSFF